MAATGGLTLLLYGVRARTWIIHHDTLDVKVRRIVTAKHGVRYVWDVVTRITFTGDVYLPSLQSERFDEILEETQELPRHIRFARRGRCALTEARTDRLLDPDHVRQIDPCVRVPDGCECAILPQKRTILLKEPFQ